MADVETELREAVEAATPRLLMISDEAAGTPPAPGKWSPKEVIGHLIDSASNNHQRFVRAQFQDDLVFPGYAQENWVAAQAYRKAPWRDLVELWRAFNLQLSRVMAAMPAHVRQKPRHPHNLHEIAWNAVPREQPATLEYFLRDYVKHMRHHLGQIPGAI